MKKLLQTLLLSALTIAAHAASYNYYAQLKAIAAPRSGGLVYADTIGSEATASFAQEVNAPELRSETPEEDKSFVATAQPAEGYGFLGWADSEQGDVFSRLNPLTLSINTASQNNQHNVRTIYARFRQYGRTLITLLPPTLADGRLGGGTYSATSGGTTTEALQSGATDMVSTQLVDLSATPSAGMKFFGWYTLDEEGEQHYFSYDQQLTGYPFIGIADIGAAFVDEETAVVQIEGNPKRYAGLEAALAAAGSAATITVVDGGTLHGHITIPAGITLLIPFDDDHHLYRDMPRGIRAVNVPEEYMRLTLAQDARLDISGEVSVSAKMRSGGGGSITGCGNTDGAYGRLHLEEGAQINLQQGGKFYAWGYVTGEGEINALSGSDVYEPFHFPGFRGGSAMSDMGESHKRVFPVNQYYIQNIEAPLNIFYGANAHVGTSAFADDKVNPATAVFIGEGGLYQPQQGARVRKAYDPATDRIAFDIWGDTRLEAFNLSIAGYIINSDAFVLPITNNMSVRIHSGNTLIVNDIALLPGASLTIDATAQVTIGGQSRAYVYDLDEWLLGQFAYPGQLAPAVYSPTRSHNRTTDELTDAQVDINGTMRLEGQLYTTAGRASIISSTGSGQVVFAGPVTAEATTYQAEQPGSVTYREIACDAAMLHNAAAYANTDAEWCPTTTAASGSTVYYAADHWGWTATWTINGQLYYSAAALTENELPDAPETQPSGEGFTGWRAERDEALQTIRYTALTGQESSLLGDANGDGAVDVTDISVLAEYIFGNTPQTFDPIAADANRDGALDVSDISSIAEMIFGMQ